MTETISGRLFSKGVDVEYGDFRDSLLRNGYAVVKGAVPSHKALAYSDEIFQWLEDFGLGFRRDDPSTVHRDYLPDINEKGMCLGYGVSHESFTWAVRQEPGVIEAFEKVYDTKDLIVSFDSINISFPRRTDIKPNKPWPHQDQDPERPGFRCLQGLVNLLPNGSKDGGLIVCQGAHLLSEEFHEAFKNEEDKIFAWTKEWYGFTEAGLKWLEDKGCQWVKVTADPGDLILWDSRTPHYNVSCEGDSPRLCVYTCYMPVADVTQEELKRKQVAFETTRMTTHWPNALHLVSLPVLRNGEPDPYNRPCPRQAVELTERGFKLTGIPYIKQEA
ncbi:hypothetical protein BJX65DRAFT_309995 [Aspergillus insuetus]